MLVLQLTLSLKLRYRYKLLMPNGLYKIAALYRFVPIEDAPALRAMLKEEFVRLNLCGILLVAPGGHQRHARGSAEAIDQMLDILNEHTGLQKEDVKFSEADEKPFNRLRVRLKREIITFKQPEADPGRLAGTYVGPREWNALMDDPDVVVFDVRNVYETTIGTFKNSIDPKIAYFTELADYVRANMNASKGKKIAMYCTGGIRCEKASAFMRAEGFPEVYHLKGGILKYLEEVPAEESKWQGECFVFDKRVAVGQGLTTGRYTMCPDCGTPLFRADANSITAAPADDHYLEQSHKCLRKTLNKNPEETHGYQ